MQTTQLTIPTDQAMQDLGAKLAKLCKPGAIIFLQGELGAGKTTLVRGFLRALGHEGKVKSPSYAIVEEYSFDTFQVNHFDFYRIKSDEELEELGLRDYLTDDAICLIEWPELADQLLLEPTISCRIVGFCGEPGRKVTIAAEGTEGKRIVETLKQ